MDKEQLINAVKNATNGTYIADNGRVTCLGWIQEYDALGRPLHGDPNIHTGQIRIDGKDYRLRTSDFHCTIEDFETGETLAEVDFTPDYIKEYWEKKKEKTRKEICDRWAALGFTDELGAETRKKLTELLEGWEEEDRFPIVLRRNDKFPLWPPEIDNPFKNK